MRKISNAILDAMELTKISELRNILKKFRVWAKKKFSQNFLVDREILEKIVAAAEIQKNENIVEIGAGTGVLTIELLRKLARVFAIEIDREILPVLNFTTKKISKNLQIFPIHILQFRVDEILKTQNYKIVANIPYHLTSPILRKFLVESENRPQKIILLTQKEVAQKICDEKKNSILRMFIAVFGRAEILKIVPPKSFFPAPKVDSAILKIEIFEKPKIKIAPREFFNFLKKGFSSPRKMLKNNLSTDLKIPQKKILEIFENLKIAENARAENLSIENWENLTNEFSQKVFSNSRRAV